MRRWGEACRLKYSVFTSNVDGHFLKAGYAEDRVVECHGTVHVLQAFESRLSGHLWPAEASLSSLVVDASTFRAQQPLPVCPPEAGSRAAGTLARPNVLMFNDWGWVETRTEAQERRRDAYLQTLPPDARVVVVEVGAGSAVPTVRNASEMVLEQFRSAKLLRVNPGESEGPAGTIAVPETGLAALKALDHALTAGAL